MRAALTGVGVLLVTLFAMTLGGSPPDTVPPGAGAELAAEVDAPIVSVIVVASTAPALVPSATDVTAPPSPTAPGTATAPEAATVAGGTAACATGNYTIEPGDYWIGIAERTNMRLDELLAVNGAAESTPLYPGATICLPPAAG